MVVKFGLPVSLAPLTPGRACALLPAPRAGHDITKIAVATLDSWSDVTDDRLGRADALIVMFLSVAVHRGPQVVKPHQLEMFPATFTMKDVADQILREDAEYAERIEASAKMDSAPTRLGRSIFQSITVDHLVNVLQLLFLRFFLTTEELEPAQDKGAVDPFAVLMSTSRTVATKKYWPSDYVPGQNQRTRDIINSLMSTVRSDPAEYAGFPDQGVADDKNNQFFFRLASIAEYLAPHADKMAARSCKIPSVFLDAAFSTCSCSGDVHIKTCLKVAGKALSQEVCAQFLGKLNTILGKPDVSSAGFKFSFHISQLEGSRHQAAVQQGGMHMATTRGIRWRFWESGPRRAGGGHHHTGGGRRYI